MSKFEKAGKLTPADIASMGLMQTPILGAIYTGSNAVESFASGHPVKGTLEAGLSALLVAAPRAARRLFRRTAEVGLAAAEEGVRDASIAISEAREQAFNEGAEIATLASELQHHPEMPREQRAALEAELKRRLKDTLPRNLQPGRNDDYAQVPYGGADSYDDPRQPGMFRDPGTGKEYRIV